MCERRSPAADPLAELEPVEADYSDEITEAVAAMEPEEWMPEPPVGSMAPDVALAHQQLERALNAHLGGGVEVRADGAIVIDSARLTVETVGLMATGKVAIRVRGVPGREMKVRRVSKLGVRVRDAFYYAPELGHLLGTYLLVEIPEGPLPETLPAVVGSYHLVLRLSARVHHG